MTSESSLAALLLTNRIVQTSAKPMTGVVYWDLVSRVGDPSALLNRSQEEIESEFGLEPELAARVVTLCGAGVGFAFERERLSESGISLVSYLDDKYPQRLSDVLGKRAPVFLLIAGDTSLLSRTQRGIVGSRNASPEASEVAGVAASRANRRGDIVVSGLARGIDQISMGRALEEDASVVGVPSEGLRVVARKREIRSLIHENRICLVSPFGPDSPFSVGNAMGRNKVVYALSSSTLVVVSDSGKGGTWEGAKEAIKGRFAQVDVWTGEGSTEGNSAIVKMGGRPVADADDLWTVDFAPPGPVPEQLGLFG